MKYLVFNPPVVLGSFLMFSLLSTYLEWSNLFKELSDQAVDIYLYCSIVLLVVGGFLHPWLASIIARDKQRILHAFSYSRNDKYLMVLLVFFFCIAVIYSGFVPIFFGAYGFLLDHNFGIPVFHGLYISFLSYVSVIFFQKYISCRVNKRKNHYLLYVILINLLYFLMARRGAIVFNSFCYLLLYIFYCIACNKSLIKLFGTILVFVGCFLYVFNFIGNYRLGKDTTDYILQVGKASAEFQESHIPSEFFFGYLYLSTPVSIFDLNKVDRGGDLLSFAVDNIIPDFIAKRFFFDAKFEVNDVEGFNVGGVFLKPYSHVGLLGVVLILVYYLFILALVVHQFALKRKRSFVSLLMFLSLSMLLPFQNLLNAGGYILQIYYGLLFVGLTSFSINGRSIFPVRRISNE